ncbi:hypothetical protein ACTFIW_011039 [Dictyostelium discoideum]
MTTNKKIKTDNNNKIFQDIIDFEILKSIINYLLTSKKNKKNNNNTSNQYKINKFYFNINEILNYILVSKKWYNFISLTISNNIINYKSFEYWLKTNFSDNSFIENYDNNQNQYDKNNLIFNYKEDKQYKISFNKEFSIVKIKESIINDYFKFNLFLDNITIDDFIEMKNKFENNQLLYHRIVVNVDTDSCGFPSDILFTIHEYVSNENSEIVSNLFKILELNFDFCLDYGYCPHSEEEEDEGCREIYLNNLSIAGYNREVGEDEETVKIFKIFKSKNIIYDGSNIDESDTPTHVNYSALFDPDNSGQQVESIKVKNEYGNEARHLIKVNQFENLHSITIPINSFQILSNLSEEMGFELNQMINSFITSKSLKNLNMPPVNSICYLPIKKYDGCDYENFVNNLNKTIESFSNSFQPLFSELNTSIERIEFDCMGLLNINTFSNLLNNKSIKYLYLNGDSDFIVYSSKPKGNGRGGSRLHLEPISINQYLFDNIFSSPLTSIRHYKIKFIELNQLKLIFNLILNNIFKLQLYSLIFEFDDSELIGEFVKEYKNLINNISTQQEQQQQQQQQKSNNINLKEFKIKIEDDQYFQELNNINNPYFTTIIKKKEKKGKLKKEEHWLETKNYNKNKSFIETYNNQNQYDKNNLVAKSFYSGGIGFNKEFSIVKIQESIINVNSALFDPDYSGQQVESIKVKNDYEEIDFVEPLHLIKVNQFENLHSITIPLNSFQILSNLSKEMGYFSIDCIKSDFGNSDNMKSELNQMINSLITSKSLKYLKITSINTAGDPINYDTYYDGGDIQTFINKINETKESFSNCFKPLFSELNTSIERIELDCCGLLNINTFSNLLKNKSIKYLYLHDNDSDFNICSLKPTGGSGSGVCQEEPISINQYLFENIFTSPLTSIRHYKIYFKGLNQLKLIFNLILNNIFKLQLYSLIFELNDSELIVEFVSEFCKEFKNLINYISTQLQQEQQKLNNINLKEFKIILYDDFNSFIGEIYNNFYFPYFTVMTKVK